MDIELIEMRDFLAAQPPFDQLPKEALDELPRSLQLRYVRREMDVMRIGEVNEWLNIVRTGAVEITSPDGVLLARIGEGDIFGENSLLRGGEVKNNVRSIEDTLLYQLSGDIFERLRTEHKRFAYWFAPPDAHRLRGALEARNIGDDGNVSLVATPIGDLLSREPVCIHADASIREAATLMSEQRVSALLINREDGSLEGIVTDRDLRSRCLAVGLSAEEPLRTIMTADPMHMDVGSYAFEAMLTMARSNVHHLPVVSHGQLKGMITATDLVHRRSTSVVYLVGDVHKQENVAGLARVSRELPSLLCSMVEADASAHSIGHMISSVGESIATRLLSLAEQHLGPPPVPYAWMAAGSQARHEQTAHSDQDNALLISDDYSPEEHGDWFESLTRFVCDGLDRCGYVYCPGDVMAMNPEWRQPLATWKKYFDRWIDTPEPKALMLSSVFFDMRCLHGEKNLFRELRDYVLSKAAKSRIFLGHMAGNALQYQPPLGFFRSFVLSKGGAHGDALDLKKGGVVPIIDLARVYALSAGVDAVNTQDRLDVTGGQGELSKAGGADLRDALEFISMVRLRSQARQIRAGEKPDNFMPPAQLSHFERDHLKEAFSVVRTLQSVLGQRYQTSGLG